LHQSSASRGYSFQRQARLCHEKGYHQCQRTASLCLQERKKERKKRKKKKEKLRKQVVPTTGPPQTWPISISAHLLAPFPDPTMHNMYICHKNSGCVRKRDLGARRVRLRPFWHRFAPFWQANGASPNLLQPCRFPGL